VADVPATNIEPTKVDTAASEACIRSGTFALLLSVVLFLLIPYWRHQEKAIALRQYRALRNNLVLYLEMLDDDPYWQKYSASQDAAESMSIAQLLELSVEAPTRETSGAKGQSIPAPVTKKILDTLVLLRSFRSLQQTLLSLLSRRRKNYVKSPRLWTS
jgi:hypothetical protein